MSNPYKPSLFLKIQQWFLDLGTPYITIQQNNEHFFLSKVLWKCIINDLDEGERNDIRVLFKKYNIGRRFEYLMIINPDFEEEFDETIVSKFRDDIQKQKDFDKSLDGKPRSVKIVANVKRMNEMKDKSSVPFTATIQFNMYGHVGFQGVQPNPAEIVYEYDIDKKVENKYGVPLELTDRIPLRVVPIVYKHDVYGGRKAYIITDDVLHKPTPTFAKPFAQRKEEIAAQRRASQRVAGIKYRNAMLKK